jgi:chromosome segregation ATPase
MISKSDPIKSRLILHYLANASKKCQQRAFNRKKLEIKLKQLKKISTGDIQKHLDELEESIADTIKIEKKIVKAHRDEDTFHRELKDKITALEKKLSKYIDVREVRDQRIERIEDKIKQKQKTKKEFIQDAKESVVRLEKLYTAAKKDKKHKKTDLNRIKKRILKLKAKIKVIKT